MKEVIPHTPPHGTTSDDGGGRVRSSPERQFIRDVIKWVRDQPTLHTTALPEHDLLGPDGTARFSGYALVSHAWSAWAYAAFLSAVIAGFAAMVSPNLIGPAVTQPMAVAAGIGIVVAGAVAVVLWGRARRAITFVVATDPAGVNAKALGRLCSGLSGSVWLFSRGALTWPAHRLAEARAIRCWVADTRGFVPAPVPEQPSPPLAA
jgi:hypothetical protein